MSSELAKLRELRDYLHGQLWLDDPSATTEIGDPELSLLLDALDLCDEALRELWELYPDLRQLMDGFMNDPDWNQEWDKSVRDRLIAWGMKYAALEDRNA